MVSNQIDGSDDHHKYVTGHAGIIVKNKRVKYQIVYIDSLVYSSSDLFLIIHHIEFATVLDMLKDKIGRCKVVVVCKSSKVKKI